MPTIPEQPAQGRAWGRALRRTPNEIVSLSIVTPTDISAANRLWEQNAPKALKNLLKAVKQLKK